MPAALLTYNDGMNTNRRGAHLVERSLEPPRSGPTWVPEAAYVHIPFCSHKCGYCDFASVAGEDSRMDDYLRAADIITPEMQHRLAALESFDAGDGAAS